MVGCLVLWFIDRVIIKFNIIRLLFFNDTLRIINCKLLKLHLIWIMFIILNFTFELYIIKKIKIYYINDKY